MLVKRLELHWVARTGRKWVVLKAGQLASASVARLADMTVGALAAELVDDWAVRRGSTKVDVWVVLLAVGLVG